MGRVMLAAARRARAPDLGHRETRRDQRSQQAGDGVDFAGEQGLDVQRGWWRQLPPVLCVEQVRGQPVDPRRRLREQVADPSARQLGRRSRGYPRVGEDRGGRARRQRELHAVPLERRDARGVAVHRRRGRDADEIAAGEMRGIADDVRQRARADRDQAGPHARPHGLRRLLCRVGVGREHQRLAAEHGRHSRAGDRLGVFVHHHERRPRHVLREPVQSLLGDEDHCP